MVLELVTGGELFERIAMTGSEKDAAASRYRSLQQFEAPTTEATNVREQLGRENYKRNFFGVQFKGKKDRSVGTDECGPSTQDD
ncbi:hypothetical protein LSAT2_006814 [Lamellibrachia satsuma]|nr:hypothetical protein LSAT2_006814 [Lamellibrachia satsuma]